MANPKRKVGLLVKGRVSKDGMSKLRPGHRYLNAALGIIVGNAERRASDHRVMILWGVHGLVATDMSEIEIIGLDV